MIQELTYPPKIFKVKKISITNTIVALTVAYTTGHSNIVKFLVQHINGRNLSSSGEEEPHTDSTDHTVSEGKKKTSNDIQSASRNGDYHTVELLLKDPKVDPASHGNSGRSMINN
jgi:hypothetical protein